MQNALARAVAQTGYPIRHLLSGPGHDAVMFGGITDMGMLFVRCGNNGISHSPLETITGLPIPIRRIPIPDVSPALG